MQRTHSPINASTDMAVHASTVRFFHVRVVSVTAFDVVVDKIVEVIRAVDFSSALLVSSSARLVAIEFVSESGKVETDEVCVGFI